MKRLTSLGDESSYQQLWREKIKEVAISSRFEAAAESSVSRSWIDSKPKGWSGSDFVKDVHLLTGNLATAGIASNPPDSHACRAGCIKMETICHVLPREGCKVLRTASHFVSYMFACMFGVVYIYFCFRHMFVRRRYQGFWQTTQIYSVSNVLETYYSTLGLASHPPSEWMFSPLVGLCYFILFYIFYIILSYLLFLLCLLCHFYIYTYTLRHIFLLLCTPYL